MVLAVAVCACSSTSGQKQSTADYGTMAWDEGKTVTSDAPPPAKANIPAGEQMIWQVSLFGIELARLALAVGQPGMRDGKEIVVVRAQLETTKAAAIFAPVNLNLTTFVQTADLQPMYQRREVVRGTPYQWVEVNMSPGGFPVRYREWDAEDDVNVEQTVSANSPLYDANSFLLAARNWQIPPGERLSVNVFREIMIWNLQLEHSGTETLKTPMGEFPTIRIEAIGRRLQRDGSIDESIEERRYTFWLSDDAKRLPLKLIAKSDYGDARMDLIHHVKAPKP